jgi:hypothetical protein
MKKDYKEDYKRFMNHWKKFGKDYSGENTHPDDVSPVRWRSSGFGLGTTA